MQNFVPILNGKHLRDRPLVSCISYRQKISYTNEQLSGNPERTNQIINTYSTRFHNI